jgi:hypothetical protein
MDFFQLMYYSFLAIILLCASIFVVILTVLATKKMIKDFKND